MPQAVCAAGFAASSSSAGFTQHLQAREMQAAPSRSPPPAHLVSPLAKLIFTAKCGAVLDALPDADIRRLFIVMFEKFATQIVTTQVQAKQELLQDKKREDTRRERESAVSRTGTDDYEMAFGIHALVDDE